MAEDVIIKIQADIADLQAKLGLVKEGMKSVDDAARKTGQSIDNAFSGKAGSNVTAASKAINDSMRNTVTQAGKVEDAYKGVAGMIGVATAETKNYTTATTTAGQVGTKVYTSLRQEIRAITQQLAQMELEGRANTAEYQNMVAKLGNLKDAMNDVAGKARFFADDIRWINTTTQAIQGMIGAYSVYTGVMALAGEENKELQKSMQRLQGLMTVMMGITQVANMLQKDSMVMTAKTVILEKAKAIQLAVSNKAMIANTIATETSTIAAKANAIAWNVASKAMKAVPFIAIVTAVAALAAAYITMRDNAERYANSQKVIAELTEKAADNIGRERSEMEILLLVARDNNESLKNRETAIKKLNELSPEYLGNITLENINTQATTDAINKYVEALEKKAIAQAFSDLLAEKHSELIKKQMESWDRLGIATKTYYEILGRQVGGGQTLWTLKWTEELDQIGSDIEKIKEAAKDADLGDFLLLNNKTTPAVNPVAPIVASVKELGDAFHIMQGELDGFDAKWAAWQKALQDQNTKDVIKELDEQIEETFAVNIPSYVDKSRELLDKYNRDKIWQDLKDNWQEILTKLSDTLTSYLTEGNDELADILQERVDLISESIDRVSEELDRELELNKAGFASNVQLKQQELDALRKQQDEAIAERDKQIEKQRQQELLASQIQATTSVITLLADAIKTGGVLGVITGVLAVAGYLSQLSALQNQAQASVQFAHGGAEILGGMSHAGGGVNLGGYEAEKGEFLGILNKKQTARYGKPLLSLFDGLNKSKNEKIAAGLLGIAGLASPSVASDSSVELKEVKEIREMRDLMKRPQKSITIENGKRIEKQGNYTKIIRVK